MIINRQIIHNCRDGIHIDNSEDDKGNTHKNNMYTGNDVNNCMFSIDEESKDNRAGKLKIKLQTLYFFPF